MAAKEPVALGRAELLDLDRALATEWRLTNSTGAWAAGTALGATTRPQQAILAVPAEGERSRVLVAKVDAELELGDGERVSLATNEYHDGTINPTGYLWLENARLEDGQVSWRWRVRDAEIEETIALAPGRRAVVLRYRLVRAPRPVRLRLTPFMTDRDADHHTIGAHDWRFRVHVGPHGCRVQAREGAQTVGLFGWTAHARGRTPATSVETGHWYWRFLHRHERWFGRPHLEDLHAPCLLGYDLQADEAAWLVLTIEPDDLDRPERLHPETWLPRPAPARRVGRSGGQRGLDRGPVLGQPGRAGA
jgi:predicted glycogen debranching enzyme